MNANGAVALYEAVLFETDELKLPARIAIATEEMQLRLRQLRHCGDDEYEYQSLLYALNTLAILKRARRASHTDAPFRPSRIGL